MVVEVLEERGRSTKIKKLGVVQKKKVARRGLKLKIPVADGHCPNPACPSPRARAAFEL
jgi:hypothetical protein